MNRLPRKERINHNNRFFIDPRPEKERERSQVSTSSAKIFINPRIEKSGGGAVAGSKRRRRSHGIIPWNENILVGSRILPTLRFINIPNDLYDPLYSTLSPSIHRLDPRRIPLSVFFLRFVLFSFTVEKRLDDYSRGEFRARTPIPDSKGVRHDQGGGGFIAPTHETFASGVKRG